MILPGAGGQSGPHSSYFADGAITVGGTAQQVLAASKSRTAFFFQNTSTAPMYLDWGVARATAVLTSGAVSGVTVTNGGAGFTYAPTVIFLGGGSTNISGNLATPQPGGATPQNVATGHATLSGGAVNAVVIDNPGSGYILPPYVLFINDPRDAVGGVTASATSGLVMPALSAPFQINGTAMFTDPVSVFCPQTGATYMCRWIG